MSAPETPAQAKHEKAFTERIDSFMHYVYGDTLSSIKPSSVPQAGASNIAAQEQSAAQPVTKTAA